MDAVPTATTTSTTDSSPDRHCHNLRDRSSRRVWSEVNQFGAPVDAHGHPHPTVRLSPGPALPCRAKLARKPEYVRLGKKHRPMKRTEPVSGPIMPARFFGQKKTRVARAPQPKVKVGLPGSILRTRQTNELIIDIESLENMGSSWLALLTAWSKDDAAGIRLFGKEIFRVAGLLATRADRHLEIIEDSEAAKKRKRQAFADLRASHAAIVDATTVVTESIPHFDSEDEEVFSSEGEAEVEWDDFCSGSVNGSSESDDECTARLLE
ncbi:hypothetical protein P7C70_g6510, partial [Phenoliferia sp. Uapishka_3]